MLDLFDIGAYAVYRESCRQAYLVTVKPDEVWSGHRAGVWFRFDVWMRIWEIDQKRP
jgi:hypothetical protein